MKLAILTAFNEFAPGFSLTGIVKDQAQMLLDHGHEVSLYVTDQYNDKYDNDLPAGVELRRRTPWFHQTDYKSVADVTDEHSAIADRFKDVLLKDLADYDAALCHDLLFQGWYLPLGIGVQRATLGLPNLRWLHWIHSIPTSNRDWWNLAQFGGRHRLIYPNMTDRVRVAEAYRTDPGNVRVIPHIKDLRSFFDFHADTRAFIRDFPGIMQADVVQVYPASADRLDSKQVDKVIRILAAIKHRGLSVFLLIADQWASTKTIRQREQKYIDMAHGLGLTDDEFTFSSRWRDHEFELGLPKRMLRELMLCANLFIFPTTHETFGLVGPEAALCGNFLVVNNCLKMQGELWDHGALGFDFGSFTNNFQPENWSTYLEAVASVVISRMRDNEGLMTRTLARQKYNWDALYHRYYRPLLEEAKTW